MRVKLETEVMRFEIREKEREMEEQSLLERFLKTEER